VSSRARAKGYLPTSEKPELIGAWDGDKKR
jgi:hypothetical protein